MQQMWQIRQMIALAMLAVCSYTDIKEKNIYIAPLVISATGGGLIALTSFAGIPQYGTLDLMTELAVPALVGIAIIVITKMARKYVGLGDGYMLAALGMIIGNGYNMKVIAISSLIASVYAIVSVIRKKKRFIAGIPFAPFVMSGYVILTINGIRG